MKLRIKYADQVAGAFILVAIIVLALALILVGLNQRWFEKTYRYKSEFLSGTGISPGTAINYRGFEIGKIERIALTDKNTVDVSFYIYDEYHDRVRDFSILELSVSPIGLGNALLFHQGRSSSVKAEGTFVPRSDSSMGKTLISSGLVDVPAKDDSITRLLAEAGPLMADARDAIVSLKSVAEGIDDAISGRGGGPVAGILADAEDIVAGLKEDLPVVLGNVDAAVGEARVAMANVNAISADVKSFAAAISDPTGLVTKLIDPKGSLAKFLDDDNELYDRFIVLMDEVDSTLKSVESISRRVEREMPGISILLDEGKTTLVKAQDILEGLKNNPLLRGGIPERRDQGGLYRSLRDEEF